MEKKIEFYMTAGIAADMDADKHFAGAIGHIIHRFLTDDWGTLCKEDCQLNEQAKKEGGRIMGAYNTRRGRVYIITDDVLANPQVTTILYADEY